MEILPTDNAPGTSSTRSTVDAPDDYIVKIYNSKKEQVASYTYTEIKSLQVYKASTRPEDEQN